MGGVTAADQHRVEMARAYGKKHGCVELVDMLAGFLATEPDGLETDDVGGYGAVIVAILRGQVEPVAGPRDCYPAKNFAALRRFLERGEVDRGGS